MLSAFISGCIQGRLADAESGDYHCGPSLPSPETYKSQDRTAMDVRRRQSVKL